MRVIVLLVVSCLCTQYLLAGEPDVPASDSLAVRQSRASSSRFLQFRSESNFSMAITGRADIRQQHALSPFLGVHGRVGWGLSPRSVYAGLYREPVFGLGAMLSTFNNPVLGNPTAVYGFLQVPVLRPGGRWNLIYEMALGISGNMNPYDPLENPENLLVSSAINTYIDLGLEARYRVDRHWDLGIGIGIKHLSNGATKRPNKGVNIVPIQFTMQYRLADHPLPVANGNRAAFKPYWVGEVSTMGGVKQMNSEAELVVKNLTSMQAGYQFSYKYRVGLGLDFAYTEGWDQRVTTEASALSRNWSVGVAGAWSWFITDRLYLPVSVGVYLHRNPENEEIDFYYQRVGVRYLFPGRHLGAGLGIKLHGGVADFIEMGLSWTFHRDRNVYRQ
jgi:hypothetical protein